MKRGGAVRIAQLANFHGPRSGGLRVALDHLGRGYVAAGHERLLVVPGRSDLVTETPHGMVAQVRSPAVPGRSGYRLVLRTSDVARLLDQWSPTSLEVADKLSLATLVRWARRRGVPAVLSSHERADQVVAAGLAAPVLRRSTTALARRFDEVVVASRYAAREFDRLPGAVTVIPLGVDLDTFRPRPAPRVDAGARLVYVGRLSPEKRPDLAIGALAELVRRGLHGATLLVVGSGPQEARLRRLAGSLPVTFRPHQLDRRSVAAAFAGADVCLAPAPNEAFGLAALEALASGVPAVVARGGAAAELVAGGAGRAVGPGACAIADAVVDLLAEPPAARRARARARAEQFPWSTAVERWLAVHERVARAGAGTFTPVRGGPVARAAT